MDPIVLEHEQSDEVPWKLLASLACSVLIVMGGMFWTYRVWKDTNQKFHELAHAQESVQSLESRVNQREASIR